LENEIVIEIQTQNILQLFVAGRPYAQTRARHVVRDDGSSQVYSNASKGLKAWKARLGAEMRLARSTALPEPLAGALCVDMTFMMPIKDKRFWGQLCHTKPDKDNLEKAVLDVMEDNGYFAVGDSQVAAGEVVKVWCRPGQEGVLVRLGRARIKKAPAQESEGEAAGDWLA